MIDALTWIGPSIEGVIGFVLRGTTRQCRRGGWLSSTWSVTRNKKLIERLGEAAKLPFPIHAHMLRHAAGYALAARGVHTRTLRAFMGHRSIANTVVYTAVADKRIRNIWGVSQINMKEQNNVALRDRS